MKCPHCGLVVTDRVPTCRGCGFSIHDLDRQLPLVPERLGFVNDFASVLSAQGKARLEARLTRFHRACGGDLALVTVASTKPVKPSEYVFWLFNRWRVGGDTHAGLLILLPNTSGGSSVRWATRGSPSSPMRHRALCSIRMWSHCSKQARSTRHSSLASID